MANYQELRDLYTDDALKNRLDVAITVAAHDLLVAASPTLEEQRWASHVLAGPRPEAEKALRFLVAANKGVSISAIKSPDDASLQTQVDGIVSSLVAARA